MECPDCGSNDVVVDEDDWYTCQGCGHTSNIAEEWNKNTV